MAGLAEENGPSHLTAAGKPKGTESMHRPRQGGPTCCEDGGVWLVDGDRVDQILLWAIVDVARLVTTASLQQGNLTQA